MLMEMKVEGVSKQVIVKMAKKKNIPEEEINKILDSQEQLCNCRQNSAQQ